MGGIARKAKAISVNRDGNDVRGLLDCFKCLKNDEKIYVLHSINDFLLSENDRKFLDSTLENRITWTSRGGHLGNLYYEKVQQKILKMLE